MNKYMNNEKRERFAKCNGIILPASKMLSSGCPEKDGFL
jgi:hypothetical protein